MLPLHGLLSCLHWTYTLSRQVSARRPGTDTLRGMLRSDLILMMCRSFKAEPCTSWHWMPFTTAL